VKLWHASYCANWIGGHTVCIAPDEATARAMLEPLMRENDWQGDPYDIEELDTTKPHVIFSGDY
jgi:hypothetical protein